MLRLLAQRYAVIRGRVTSVKRKLLKHGWQLPTGMSLVMIFGAHSEVSEQNCSL
jgi:hypothetical protein